MVFECGKMDSLKGKKRGMSRIGTHHEVPTRWAGAKSSLWWAYGSVFTEAFLGAVFTEGSIRAELITVSTAKTWNCKEFYTEL